MKFFLLQNRILSGGVIAVVFFSLLIIGALWAPDAFFRAYWFALMFWAQLSIGALIVLLLQYLTGGEWGRVAAPLLRAIASGLFLLLPLFLPALFALPHIFSWTQIEPGVSAPVLVNKLPWLNTSAFLIRTLVYLTAFSVVLLLRFRDSISAVAGPFLVLVIVMISFCSADWMMSLQPTFYSSLYPFLYFSGAMVSTFSVTAGTVAWMQLKGLMPSNPELLLAFGKLLFASVLFWGYIVFCQFIIIWTGNLPDEAEWYIVRSEPAWLWFTLLVLAFHFAVPFCLLLSQDVKMNARQLLAICIGLFTMHLLEVFWMMRPTPGDGFNVSSFDALLPVIIGAGWLWFVLGSREVTLKCSFSPREAHES
jgi:hypothetical protein